MTGFKNLVQAGTTGEFAFCLCALTFTGHCSNKTAWQTWPRTAFLQN